MTKLNDEAIRVSMTRRRWNPKHCKPLMLVKWLASWLVGGLAVSPIFLWMIAGMQ